MPSSCGLKKLSFGTSILSSLVWIATVTLLAFLLIGYIWMDSERKQAAEDQLHFEKNFLDTEKNLLRSEVVRLKRQIIRQKAHAEKDYEKALMTRIQRAYHVAEGIYNTHAGTLSDDEIKARIINTLGSVKFSDNNHGYIFIVSSNESNRLEQLLPENTNKHLAEFYPTSFSDVYEGLMDIMLSPKQEGYVSYDWQGNDTDQLIKKRSFVKYFAPFDLFIGTGYDIEFVSERIKEEIFQDIADITFGLNQEGYFFINSYTGDLFVTNGQYFGASKNIWDAEDAKGIKVVQENAKLAQMYPEGGFSTYTWKKNNGQEADKISFILGFDEWNVFIGAGAYLDTIKQAIDQRKEMYDALMHKRTISSVAIIFLTLMIIVTVIYVIGRRLSHNILLFQRYLESSIDHRVKINTSYLHFKEFKHLAVSINHMIDGLNLQAEELKHRASHDHLTALPNRMYGSNQLELMINQTIKNNTTAALLFIDLDHFKEINDSLGHSTGDELLRQVSDRLRSNVGVDCVVARLGGDEFTVITGVLKNKNEACMLAQQLLDNLKQPYRVAGNDLSISASIGVSVFPADGDSAEVLLRNADSAMYEAKRGGRNNYRLYRPEMTKEIFERFTLNEEIRDAINQKQFELYYQPQLDLTTGELIGAEALIRWHHPEKGLIPPAKFIPIAEASGQIIQIGDWVLDEACKKLSQWNKQGIHVPKLAINVSNQQMDISLVSKIKGLLFNYDCPPSQIELEITESTLMENPEHMAGELRSLKDIGISIAIDDFGTGYSSLSYLKQLPIDKLKVDRSFTNDLQHDDNDLAITKAIVAMTQSMNLRVIAEGIENQAQIDILTAIACYEGQGYFFSRPLPEADFLDFCKQNQRHDTPEESVSLS